MNGSTGVFCFEATWQGWSSERLASELGRLRDLGISEIVTETVEPPTRLIHAADAAGLRTFVSVPCFSAHDWPHLIGDMDLHPVGADGRPRPRMEWYTGLIPTHPGYNKRLQQRIRRIARAHPAGLILDFVRWPLHWELELRAGTPEPIESSFDQRSIRAFATWLRAHGRAYDQKLDPAVLTGPLRDQWTDFKCDVISRFTCSTAEAVRAIDASIVVGAFVVPATEEQRRRLLGQDVGAMGGCLDVLLPMAYHGILYQPVGFVSRIATDVQERAAASVTPVVQVTAEQDVAGPWDWGTDVSPMEFGRAVEEAMRVAGSVLLFPLEGLDEPRRDVLSDVLDSR